MTALSLTRSPLSTDLPRMVCPYQVQISDLVRIDSEHLPVVITDSRLEGVRRVLDYVSEIRTSNGEPVFEGSQVFEPASPIILLRRGVKAGV